jgi:hypothetical protein
MSEDVSVQENHYADLNHVRWYACMSFEERLNYLDRMIAVLEAKIKAWRAAAPPDNLLAQFRAVPAPVSEHLESLRVAREIELADRAPMTDAARHWYADPWVNPRWKRIRARKFASVGHRCEEPGCGEWARECHHRHYGNLGSEENSDLEALCHTHHRARHGFYR